MKVKVINPTSNDIQVTVEGQEYFVKAKGTVEVEEAHAEYWKERLHNFLLIEVIPEDKKEEKKEQKEDKKEDKKKDK